MNSNANIEAASSNNYTVQIYSDGEFLFQSDVYGSKKHAKSLIEYMTAPGTELTYIVYKNRPQESTRLTHTVGYGDEETEPEDVTDSEMNEDLPLSNMIIESYGKGYILIPLPDDPRCGEKYFYEHAFWRSDLNAWFFKREYLQDFIDLGADPQFEQSATSSTDHTEIDVDYDLTGMTFRSYGKGYLMTPYSDYEFEGEPYFMGGWWKPSLNGWFFKKNFYDTLVNAGAIEEVPQTQSHSTFENMAITTYGKGYLVTTHSKHPQYAKYYYYDTHGFTNSQQEDGTFTHAGFWNSKAKGWFFRKSSLQYLTDVAGAKLIKDEPTHQNTSTFTMSDDLTSMTISHYGKGYLLKPKSNDNRVGEKYYNLPDGGQGWWREDLSGWFFKARYFEELVDMGAKYSEKSSKKSRSGRRS